MLDDATLARLKTACEDANPAYVENILAMDDARFGEWLTNRVTRLGQQTVAELAALLSGDLPDRRGHSELGFRIVEADLNLFLFVLKERHAKFLAIENTPS